VANQSLWNGENLLGSWKASIAVGDSVVTRNSGKLLLTNQRLIFDPLKLFDAGNGILGTSFKITNVILSVDANFTLLRDINSVQASGNSRVELGIVGRKPRYYLVAAPGMHRPWSSRHSEVRDDAVQRISEAVANARSISE
jgi:hypothetical protein